LRAFLNFSIDISHFDSQSKGFTVDQLTPRPDSPSLIAQVLVPVARKHKLALALKVTGSSVHFKSSDCKKNIQVYILFDCFKIEETSDGRKTPSEPGS
jgi:hypothetical protein